MKRDVYENLNDDYYDNCIKMCKYKKNLKGYLAKFALRHRLCFLIYLYNKRGR